MGYSKEDLITARQNLFNNIVQYFLAKEGVLALFVAGSIAEGTTDEFSDVDFRVVITPERHQQFISERLCAPKQWGEFLFNEWVENTIFCVSHFKPFNKADVFYFTTQHLKPSPWYSLPIQVIHDPKGFVARLIEASRNLAFTPSIDEVDRAISKGLACAHEVYRQVMRNELFYAQSLLDKTRFYMIQADDYLSKNPPHSSGFAHLERRGSRKIIETLSACYPKLERRAILNRLAMLLEVYRMQVIELHNMLPLERDRSSDLYSVDAVVEWCKQEAESS